MLCPELLGVLGCPGVASASLTGCAALQALGSSRGVLLCGEMAADRGQVLSQPHRPIQEDTSRGAARCQVDRLTTAMPFVLLICTS